MTSIKKSIVLFLCISFFSSALFARQENRSGNLVFELNDIRISPDDSVNDLCKDKTTSEAISRTIVFNYTSTFYCIEKSKLLKNNTKETENPNLLVINIGEVSNEEVDETIERINNTTINTTLVNHFNPINGKEALLISSLDELKIPLEEMSNFNDLIILIKREGKDFVKFIQFNLKSAGYYDGAIDGGFGPESQSAFQEGLYKKSGQDPSVTFDEITKDNFNHAIGPVMDVLFNGAIKIKSNDDPKTSHGNPEGDGSTNTNVSNQEQEKQAQSNHENEETQPEPNDGSTWTTQFSKNLNTINKLQRENGKLFKENNRLKEELKNKTDLNIIFNSSLFSLLKLEIEKRKNEFTYVGEFKNGDTKKVNPDFILKDTCSFKANQTLFDALDWYFHEDCTNIILEEYDVGESILRKRKLNQKANTLIIPILPKQVSEITSFKSDPLIGFKPNFDPSRCYLNIEFYSKDETLVKFDPINLYIEGDEQFYLSDEGQIKIRSISWQDRKIKLVIPDESNSSCEITDPDDFIEILTDDEHADVGFSPKAVVSREGGVTLKNVPLKQTKGKTLAVFLDTLVGPSPDAKNFGFNDAIDDDKAKDIQKIYFSGFLEAIEKFANTQSEFENFIVYRRIDGAPSPYSEIFSTSKTEGFDTIGEFKEDFMANFVAGAPGNIQNKNREHKKLMDKNRNTFFVSFGPSGYKKDKACGTPKPRSDIKQKFVIFDVWSKATVSDLVENNVVKDVEERLAFQCNNAASVIGFKVLRDKVAYEIEDVVLKQLEVFASEF